MPGGPPDNSNQRPTDPSEEAVRPSGALPDSGGPHDAAAVNPPDLDALIQSLQSPDSSAVGEGATIHVPSEVDPALHLPDPADMDEIIASLAGDQDERSIEVATGAPRATAPIVPPLDEFTSEANPGQDLAVSGQDAPVADFAALDTLLAQVDDSLSNGREDAEPHADTPLQSRDAACPEAPDVSSQPGDAPRAPRVPGDESRPSIDASALDAFISEAGEAAVPAMDALRQALSGEPPAALAEAPVQPQSPEPAKPVPSLAEPAPPDADDMDAIIAALTGDAPGAGEDVGSENLAAAGTVQERKDTDETAREAIHDLLKKAPAASAKPAAPQAPRGSAPISPQAASEVAKASPSDEPKHTRSPMLLRLPLPLLAKAGASLAAGLLFGLAAYVLLSNYTSRVPELDVPDVARTQDLEPVMEQARTAIAAGDHAAAARLLEAPLRAAPPSPLRTKAELLRLEAAYRALPPQAAKFEIEIVNSYIDTFLAQASSHPRTPEILQWKATLYERADVLFAAYDVYNQLLTAYPDLPNRPELLLRAGRLALDTGRYTDAAGQLERLVKTFPGAPQAAHGTLLLGEAMVHLGRQAEGEALLTRVAQANAHSRLGADACTALGRMALDRGDYPAAISLLKTRLQSGTTSDGNDEVLLMLAKACRAANQTQEAQDALRDIIRFFPESASAPQAYLELTHMLDLAGRRDDALRIASEAAHRHPGNPEILLRYAHLRELDGDARGAAQALLSAEQAGASDPQILLTAGNQFLKAGYSDDAEKTFHQLLAAFPGTPQSIAANVALAKLAFKRNESGRAMALMLDMAHLAQNTPQEIEVMLALGEMYQELGLLDQAAETYRGIAARASEPEILAQAARALYRAGAWSEGNEVARRVEVATLTPSTAYAFLMEYGHAMRLADSSKALQLMEQAHAEYPGERTMSQVQRLVETGLALDRFDRALAIAEELSATVDSANAEDYRELLIACGDYAMQRQDYAQAATCYTKVLEVNDRDTRNAQWARFQLASALHALGKLEEARPLLDAIAASTSPWAAEAQLKLGYLGLRARMDGTSDTPDPSGDQAP